jgi:hypothetical protein
MKAKELRLGLYKVTGAGIADTYRELVEVRHIASNGRVTVIISPKSPAIATCIDLMPHRVEQLNWERVGS